MGNLDKPITTQEELDAVIGDRLRRERESAAKRYEGWKSPEDVQKLNDDFQKRLDKAMTGKDTEMKALQESLAKAEKDSADKDALIAEGRNYKNTLGKIQAASAAGLAIKYADRLKGETEEEWKKDAEELAKDFGTASRPTPPLGNPEPRPEPRTTREIERDAFRSMLSKMND